MHFDLNGAANYTYYSRPDASAEVGSFVLDTDNQTLQINGPNILGGANPDEGGYNPSGLYTIISLTEDELVLYYADAIWGSGRTWVFIPE